MILERLMETLHVCGEKLHRPTVTLLLYVQLEITLSGCEDLSYWGGGSPLICWHIYTHNTLICA